MDNDKKYYLGEEPFTPGVTEFPLDIGYGAWKSGGRTPENTITIGKFSDGSMKPNPPEGVFTVNLARGDGSAMQTIHIERPETTPEEDKEFMKQCVEETRQLMPEQKYYPAEPILRALAEIGLVSFGICGNHVELIMFETPFGEDEEE